MIVVCGLSICTWITGPLGGIPAVKLARARTLMTDGRRLAHDEKTMGIADTSGGRMRVRRGEGLAPRKLGDGRWNEAVQRSDCPSECPPSSTHMISVSKGGDADCIWHQLCLD